MFQIEAKASHKRAISQKLQTTNYINLSGSLKDYVGSTPTKWSCVADGYFIHNF
jgi:hypothetical protein